MDNFYVLLVFFLHALGKFANIFCSLLEGSHGAVFQMFR